MEAKIIQKVEVTQEMVASKYGISQSLIYKWSKEKDSIISAATNKYKKMQHVEEGCSEKRTESCGIKRDPFNGLKPKMILLR